jgi:NADH-quinone oxidoreductase subunit L
MTFWGEHRGVPAGHGHEGHDHESHDHGDGHGHGHADPQEQPWTMTLPLVVLAALSLVGGYIGLAAVFTGGSFPNLLHDWFHPVFAASEVHLRPAFAASHDLAHAAEVRGVILSVLVAFAAIGASVFLYRGKDKLYDVFEANFPPLHKLLWNKWYIDEIYEASLIKPIVVTSREFLWRIVDDVIIDGFVNLVGGIATNGARLLGKIQDGDTGNYAGWMVAGLLVFGAFAVAASMMGA